MTPRIGLKVPCCWAQAGQRAPQPLASAASSLRNSDFLLQLLVAREGRCLSLLTAALAASGVHPSKEEAFDIWMKQQSDLVQVGNHWQLHNQT